MGDIQKLTAAIKEAKDNANEIWGQELITQDFLNKTPVVQAYAYCLVRAAIFDLQDEDVFINGNIDPEKGLVKKQIQEKTLLETFIFWHDTLHNSLADLELSTTDDCFIRIMPFVVPYYVDLVVNYSEKFLGQKGVQVNHKKLNAWITRTTSDFLTGIDDRGRPDTPTQFRGIELNSPGHKKLCERLKEMGLMFMIESPCFLTGDVKNYRKIDLIVVKDNKAVIVEVDGSSHTGGQREDDNLRDSLITDNWSNTLRFSHREVQDETHMVISKILKKLDRKEGMIN